MLPLLATQLAVDYGSHSKIIEWLKEFIKSYQVFPCHKTIMKTLLALKLVVLLYQRKAFINDGISFIVIFNFSIFTNVIFNF